MLHDHRRKLSHLIQVREGNYEPLDEPVQIDETMWSHKDKSHYRDPLPRAVSRIRRQVWIFGIIGSRTGRAKIFFVEARNHVVLGNLIRGHIAPNNIVKIDGRGAYNAIDWEGMQIRRAVHVHRENLAIRNS